MEVLAVPDQTPFLESITFFTQPVKSPQFQRNMLQNNLVESFQVSSSPSTNPQTTVKQITLYRSASLYEKIRDPELATQKIVQIFSLLEVRFQFIPGTTPLFAGRNVCLWVRLTFPNTCGTYALAGVPGVWETVETNTNPVTYTPFPFAEIFLPNQTPIPNVTFVQWNSRIASESFSLTGDTQYQLFFYPEGPGWNLLQFTLPSDIPLSQGLDGCTFVLRGIQIAPASIQEILEPILQPLF